MHNILKLERDKALRDLHTKILKTPGINPMYMTRDVLIDVIMNSPAPRFYVDVRSAYHIIQQNKHGVRMKRTNKQRMAEDLTEKFDTLKAAYPDMNTDRLIEKAINMSAKSFYVSPRTVEEIVYNYTGR